MGVWEEAALEENLRLVNDDAQCLNLSDGESKHGNHSLMTQYDRDKMPMFSVDLDFICGEGHTPFLL